MDNDIDPLSICEMDEDIDMEENVLEEDSESFNFCIPSALAPESGLFSKNAPVGSHEWNYALGGLLNKKTRANTQQILVGGGTTCVDQDDSGTYDPKEEQVAPLRRQARGRKLHDSLSADYHIQLRDQIKSNGFNGLIAFIFTSRKNLDYLRSISSGLFNIASNPYDDECAPSFLEDKTNTTAASSHFKIPSREDNLASDQPIMGQTAPSSPTVRPRMYLACNQCRNSGNGCSLRRKTDLGPCSRCRKTSQCCQFVFIPPSQLVTSSRSSFRIFNKSTEGSKNGKYRKSQQSSYHCPQREDGVCTSPAVNTKRLYRDITKNITMKQDKLYKQGQKQSFPKRSLPPISPVGVLVFGCKLSSLVNGSIQGRNNIFITTSYCHPIKFNHVPSSMPIDACSWCNNPLFGLYGLSTKGRDYQPRRVEGFYNPDGNSFVEIRGGYSELGHLPSKMCVTCTFDRIKIIGCEFHQVKQLSIADLDGWVLNEDKGTSACVAFGQDPPDFVGAKFFLNVRWCSICPNLATFKCVTVGDGVEGCGLLLCENCEDLLGKVMKSGVTGGNKVLDTLVREVGSQNWIFVEGVRADATFLTSEGELMKILETEMSCKPVTLEMARNKEILSPESMVSQNQRD